MNILMVMSVALVPRSFAQLASLEAPMGGRPAALGHAYTALARDGYAPIWNPAAIPRLRGPVAAVMHSSNRGGVSRHLMTAAFPINRRHGVGVVADFADRQGIFSGAYGVGLTPQWSVGAASRFPERSTDLTTYYRFDHKLSLGAAAANLGKHGQGQGRAGAAYSPMSWFTFSLEGVSGRAGAAAIRTGIEAVAQKMFALRVGVDSSVEGSSALGLTLGAGLNWAGYNLDAAVVPRGGATNGQLSLVLRFGADEDKPSEPLSGSASAPAPAPTPALATEPADWDKPRRPEIPEKPVIEEAVQPQMIWLP